MNITNDAELNAFADELKTLGYTIIAPEKPSTFMFFFKDGRMGYVQKSMLGGGYDFSTTHKPNSKSGTGYSVSRNAELNRLEAAKTLQGLIPSFAYDAVNVKRYESPEEFVGFSTNQILKYQIH